MAEGLDPCCSFGNSISRRGAAEEILYLLGILLDPNNAEQPLPVIFTGPPSAAEYFGQIDHFIGANEQ